MNFSWPGSNIHSPNDGDLQPLNAKSQPIHHFPSPDGSTIHDWLLAPSLPPPFSDYVSSPTSSENGCSFRHEVVDECYKSRFWSRALEYYLLENQQEGCLYRCLMDNCPERDFKDPRAMLRHMKHCKLFPNGQFWCPTCQKVEPFKVVSKKKCSWDRVNVARKLYQKSLKVLQRISNHRKRPHCYCDCHLSQNAALGNSLLSPSEPSMPVVESGHFGLFEQSATVTQYEPFELPSNMMISELSARKSIYTNSAATPRHSSYDRPPIPQTPYNQISPSELSSASLRRSGHSSDISVAPTDHTTESPVLGRQFPTELTDIGPQSIPPTREGSQVKPLLTVDTRQSVSDVQLSPALMFNPTRDSDTFGSSMDIGGFGIAGFTPTTASQTNEMFPFNTHPVPEECLIPQSIMDFQPSPSISVPSQSNSDISPSSMSSGPDLQCHYAGCDFRPSGRIENQRAYFRKHLKNHKNIVIPCEHCDKTFTRQDNLTSHNRKVHPEFWVKRPRGSLDSLRSADQPKRKESRREAYRVS